MGTSQSVNPSVKNNPNWGDLSKAIVSASQSGDITEVQLQTIMKRFVNAVGGGRRAGRGQSKVFGRAGISRAQRLMSFVSKTKTIGFNDALREIGILDLSNLSVNDFINHLLIYCSEGNSNLDETAANSAMDELLKHIFDNVDSLDDIENIFEQADISTQHEWICLFFSSYIMEFSDELFSTRIFEKEGDRVRVFQDIKNYIQRSLEDLNVDNRLQNVDWNGEEGSIVIKDLQTEILEIWSQE